VQQMSNTTVSFERTWICPTKNLKDRGDFCVFCSEKSRSEISFIFFLKMQILDIRNLQWSSAKNQKLPKKQFSKKKFEKIALVYKNIIELFSKNNKIKIALKTLKNKKIGFNLFSKNTPSGSASWVTHLTRGSNFAALFLQKNQKILKF
jgi:hypothetical protein